MLFYFQSLKTSMVIGRRAEIQFRSLNWCKCSNWPELGGECEDWLDTEKDWVLYRRHKKVSYTESLTKWVDPPTPVNRNFLVPFCSIILSALNFNMAYIWKARTSWDVGCIELLRVYFFVGCIFCIHSLQTGTASFLHIQRAPLQYTLWKLSRNFSCIVCCINY